MMFWYGNAMSGWWYVLMMVGMVAFWIVIAVAVIALVRGLAHTPELPSPHVDTPEQVLAHRLARGEIDDDEYQRKLHLLQGDDHRVE